jgi:hypothetical protein
VPKIQITYHRFLKTLLILHLGLMMAQLIFIVIIFILVNEESSVIDINTQNILLIGVPLTVIVIIVSGRFFYQQQLKKIRLKTNLGEKFRSYQMMQILQFAFSEMGALTCFLASFLSQNLVFVYGSIGVLLYFLSIRPSKNKIEKELALDFTDQNKLSDPNFILYETESSEAD